MESEIKEARKRVIGIICASYVLVLIMFYSAFKLTVYFSETHYLTVKEQKALSELDIYHDGIRKLTQEKIEDKLSTLETAASLSYLFTALENNKIGEVDDLLEQAINQKNSFDRIFILDETGKLLTIKGIEDESKIIHGNYSNRDYYQNVMKYKQTRIGEIIKAYGDYWVITASTPIFDTDGKVKYILAGSDKLENLVDDFNFKTRFANLSSILVDEKGNIVISEDRSIKEKKNILNKDNFVKSFIKSDNERFCFETNYKNEKSYVRGSVVSLAKSRFFLFSYLPYEEIEKELHKLRSGIGQLYFLIFIASSAIFFFGWLTLLLIGKDFIKKLTKNVQKILPVFIGFILMFNLIGPVFAGDKNYRAIIVDKNLNIVKIVNYTKEDVQPKVYLDNEYGIELPYTESLDRHYSSLKSSLNFNKTGVIYDANKSYILNLISRLFYVIVRSLGGN